VKWTLALALCFLLAPFAPAQDAAPAPENKVLSPEELAARQKEVGERLAKIEDTMNRIVKQLAKRNPDQAALLKLAWQRSKDDRNLEKISDIETLLRSELFNEAYDKQRQLETALNRLLDILLDRDAERKDLQDQIKRLEDLNKLLSDIIEEERDQYLKSEKFADPEKALQNAAAAKAKLSDLIQRERSLAEKTKSPQADSKVADLEQRVGELLKDQVRQRDKNDAETQQTLAERAAALTKEIADHAAGLPDAMKGDGMGRRNPADQAAAAAQRAGESMGDAAAKMKGGGDFGASQRDAEQELREAQDALRRLAQRAEQHNEQGLGAEQERIRKDTGRLQEDLERLERSAPGTNSGSGSLGKAQGDMNQAESKLGKGRREDAVPHEEDALKELERAYQQLEEFEKELKRLIQLPDYEKMTKEQEQTTGKTDDLLKKMKEEQGQQQGGDGQPTPGQQGVEGAKGAMQQAERNLRGHSANQANRNQKEAVERLEKAREELEEALRQLREEEQLMLLEALERRLQRMLQQQTKIRKETLALNLRLRDAAEPPRAAIDKGRQLGDGEAELSVEAEKLLEILREEGTTVVIPDVVEDMRMDLDSLAKRLRKLDTGDYTQQVQQDVMDTLRELLEVIREELNRRQGDGGGNGDSSEGDPDENLLPTSAELKMLKALQVRVNKRTSTFDRMVKKDEDERHRLAEKQEGVGTLTRTMADRLNREEDQ